MQLTDIWRFHFKQITAYKFQNIFPYKVWIYVMKKSIYRKYTAGYTFNTED